MNYPIVFIPRLFGSMGDGTVTIHSTLGNLDANHNDPAIFFKSRSGPGHTVNAGTILGKIIVAFGVALVCAAILLI